MKKVMITCREATEMIAKKEEGRVSFESRMQLWYHLFLCKWCRAFKKQDKYIADHFSNLDENNFQELLSESEKNAMIEKMNQL